MILFNNIFYLLVKNNKIITTCTILLFSISCNNINKKVNKEGFYNITDTSKYAEYVVTSLKDTAEKGSLRFALESTEALKITFKVDGIILLYSDIFVKPNKIIDAKRSQINIRHYGLRLKKTKNIIIKNIKFSHGIKDNKNGDAIEIISSTNILINHCTFSNYFDGLIDIKRAKNTEASNITISWCYFSNHNKVMMIGLHVPSTQYEEKHLYVTIHHCYFNRTNQRHPRLTKGYVHLYNNIIKWNYYGAAVYDDGYMFIENNYFIGKGRNLKSLQYTRQNKSECTGKYYSVGNLYLMNAYSIKNNEDIDIRYPDYRNDYFLKNSLDALSNTLFNRIKDEAGATL